MVQAWAGIDLAGKIGKIGGSQAAPGSFPEAPVLKMHAMQARVLRSCCDRNSATMLSSWDASFSRQAQWGLSQSNGPKLVQVKQWKLSLAILELESIIRYHFAMSALFPSRNLAQKLSYAWCRRHCSSIQEPGAHGGTVFKKSAAVCASLSTKVLDYSICLGSLCTKSWILRHFIRTKNLDFTAFLGSFVHNRSWSLLHF